MSGMQVDRGLRNEPQMDFSRNPGVDEASGSVQVIRSTLYRRISRWFWAILIVLLVVPIVGFLSGGLVSAVASSLFDIEEVMALRIATGAGLFMIVASLVVIWRDFQSRSLREIRFGSTGMSLVNGRNRSQEISYSDLEQIQIMDHFESSKPPRVRLDYWDGHHQVIREIGSAEEWRRASDGLLGDGLGDQFAGRIADGEVISMRESHDLLTKYLVGGVANGLVGLVLLISYFLALTTGMESLAIFRIKVQGYTILGNLGLSVILLSGSYGFLRHYFNSGSGLRICKSGLAEGKKLAMTPWSSVTDFQSNGGGYRIQV
ncbi:MAG: hypothetical protein QF752_09080, partial [Planctomycetota bacterium]|nr:hypothetical protein [Planctomycetota bacterium]